MTLFTHKGSLTFLGKLGNLMLAMGLFCAALFQGVVLCLCPVEHPACTADADSACACAVAHTTCAATHPDDPQHPEAMHHRCEHLYLDSVPPAEYAQRERIRVFTAFIACLLYMGNTPALEGSPLRVDPHPRTRYVQHTSHPVLIRLPAQRLC